MALTSRRRLSAPVGVAALLAAAGGCSSSEFDLAPVAGHVTIDGQPFAQGKVMFSPIATGESRQAGKPALGRLGSDGSFTLSTYEPNDGAIVGEHWVTVIYNKPTDGAAAAPPGFSRVAAPQKVSVAAGQDNRIDIALTREMIAKYGTLDD
jgi:hypothetical protein